MSCHNNNCHPSGLPQANNECCADVKEAARFAYSNAQQAAASATNAAATLANSVQKSGDTMTGALVLSGDPVLALGASTKQYVDNAVSIGLAIPDGSITTPKLANLAVQTGKIDDLAVTTNKIANNAVDGTKIPDLALTTNKIADNQVTYAKLGTSEKLRVAKAWVNFNGTTSPSTIRSSYNVSSVTKNGTGDYTVNFATPTSDENYSVSGSSINPSGIGILCLSTTVAPTTSSLRVETLRTSPLGAFDSSNVSIQVFGN